jgi:hypothetical protein
MPLEHSTSNKARQRNIEREIHEGDKPIKQAVAIGYSEQREAKKHHKKAKMGDGNMNEEHPKNMRMSEKYEGHNKEEPAKMGEKWNEGEYPLKSGEGSGLEKTEYPIKCGEKYEGHNEEESAKMGKRAKLNAEESPMGRKDSEFKMKHANPSKNISKVGEMSKTAKAPGSFGMMMDHGHHPGKSDMKQLCMSMPKLGKVKK